MLDTDEKRSSWEEIRVAATLVHPGFRRDNQARLCWVPPVAG